MLAEYKYFLNKNFPAYTTAQGGYGVFPKELPPISATIRPSLIYELSAPLLLDKRKKISILDAGCGNGVWSLAYLHYLTNIANIPIDTVNFLDIDTGAIRQTLAKIPETPFRASITQCNVIEMGRIKENFDYIINRFVLHWLTPGEQERAVAEMTSKLNPGGVLVVDCGTPFNAASLGNNVDVQVGRLDISPAYDNPETGCHSVHHGGFGKNMYFPTHNRLGLLLDKANLIVDEMVFYPGEFSNGCTNSHTFAYRRECMAVCAQKPA